MFWSQAGGPERSEGQSRRLGLGLLATWSVVSSHVALTSSYYFYYLAALNQSPLMSETVTPNGLKQSPLELGVTETVTLARGAQQ